MKELQDLLVIYVIFNLKSTQCIVKEFKNFMLYARTY